MVLELRALMSIMAETRQCDAEVACTYGGEWILLRFLRTTKGLPTNKLELLEEIQTKQTESKQTDLKGFSKFEIFEKIQKKSLTRAVLPDHLRQPLWPFMKQAVCE